MNIMLRICQKYFIAKVEQDWVMLWHSIIAKWAGMDQLQQYLQNILTEHLQNMHGSLCSIKFTWQQNNSRQGLREITKQNTCRANAQKMHRLNDTKITNLQVLISNSS